MTDATLTAERGDTAQPRGTLAVLSVLAGVPNVVCAKEIAEDAGV